MRTLQDIQEFDPTAYTSIINNPGYQMDAQPLHERAGDPYLTYDMTGQAPYPIQSRAALDRFSGREYDCVSMNMLSRLVDVMFVMAPGKPIDQGSANSGFHTRTSTGVYLQNKQITSSLAYAGTAPYTGIYTGVKGYLESIE